MRCGRRRPRPPPASSSGEKGRFWFLRGHAKRRSPSVNSSRGCPRVAGRPTLTGQVDRDPLGQLMVTKVGVIVGEEGGVVCVEAKPEPRHWPTSSRLDHPTRRAGHLRPAPSQLPRSWRDGAHHTVYHQSLRPLRGTRVGDVLAHRAQSSGFLPLLPDSELTFAPYVTREPATGSASQQN
jgi:hypothetical protein